MNYNYMLTNIVRVINYMCIKNCFLIDIYRNNNDIRIDIVDKDNEQIIYENDFKELKNEYNSLLNDLMGIFCMNDITISKLFRVSDNIYKQHIYTGNLEFNFDVDGNNFIEVKNASQRHHKFNLISQNSKTFKKQKTNQSTLIVTG